MSRHDWPVKMPKSNVQKIENAFFSIEMREFVMRIAACESVIIGGGLKHNTVFFVLCFPIGFDYVKTVKRCGFGSFAQTSISIEKEMHLSFV